MSREASAKPIRGLEISAPEWFQRDDFCEWIKHKATASWHEGDIVNEFSDAFTLFDHGTGPDELSMPHGIWQEICSIAEEQNFTFGLIWIKPI